MKLLPTGYISPQMAENTGILTVKYPVKACAVLSWVMIRQYISWIWRGMYTKNKHLLLISSARVCAKKQRLDKIYSQGAKIFSF